MDKFINTGLLTFPNIVTIGAILIFWALIAFALSTLNAAGASAPQNPPSIPGV